MPEVIRDGASEPTLAIATVRPAGHHEQITQTKMMNLLSFMANNTPNV